MSALLRLLPGDIPELLRRGSPVVHAQHLTQDVVREMRGADHMRIAGSDLLMWIEVEDWQLDLRDETARSHAARWAIEHWRRMSSPQGALSESEYRRCRDALDYRDMDRVAIDDLARLVLRLAGRTP